MNKKFRAWDGLKFVAVQKLEFIPAEKSFSGEAGFNINDYLGVPEHYVQQWTGLFDKNGREIYEGDIVHRFAHYSLMSVPSIDEYKEIKWWSEGGRWNYTPCSDCSLEVVGNIFENPLDNPSTKD